MRVPAAPTPTSAITTQVDNGYQLCARCGKVLVEGETVVVVPRAPFWLIHTHQIGPNCPPKAVKGWKAVRASEAIRTAANVITPREAEPFHLGAAAFPSVCLLDNKHIKAELALVDYAPSDESPANAEDIRALLSRVQFRMLGDGTRAVAQNGLDGSSHSQGQWQPLIRNFVEDGLITSIDENSLSNALQTLVESLRPCRRSYATFRTAPPIDRFPHAFVGPHAQRKLRTYEPRRVRLPKADHDVLTWDAKGRPAEFALYSNRKVLKRGRKRISELEAWGPKPVPIGLPYSSSANPELYRWQQPPQCKTVRHWPNGESQIPYGPVAVLNPVDLAVFNTQRKD
jgi:hypothetical protein